MGQPLLTAVLNWGLQNWKYYDSKLNAHPLNLISENATIFTDLFLNLQYGFSHNSETEW
jgi:hypothetical protein